MANVVSKAENCRIKGNQFYQEKQLEKAIVWYRKGLRVLNNVPKEVRVEKELEMIYRENQTTVEIGEIKEKLKEMRLEE